MGRVNFNKVEQIINDKIQQMKIDKIILSSDDRYDEAAEMTWKERGIKHQGLILLVKWILKRVENLVDLLEIDKDELKRLLGDRTKLSEEDWAKILEIDETCRAIKAKVIEQVGPEDDEEKIEEEMKQVKNKRFNLNDKWKPV